ncbi:MAG: hypothetical protein SFX73_39425 [Kofleriaceae bacterium]|nr:hypothetical protein [Kofleriaceae bacterium]
MSKAAAALAYTPSLAHRAETLTQKRGGPAWVALTSVPAETTTRASEPIWEEPTQPMRVAALPTLDPVRERELVATIIRPIDPRDGHRVGNDKREQDLMALFEALPVLEAMELQRRLRIGRADDVVAVAFGRLVVERRQRLMMFLGNARRRAAVARG